MAKNRRPRAFTLIEVLIVVVIMAVLAATIIPQFSSSTKDAKESSLKFNLHTMRSQIELYKVHHLGKYPEFANFEQQMTSPTNMDGGTTGETPYGPYMQEVPVNPFNDQDTLKDVKATGELDGDGTTGWQYDETTGGIWPNHSDYTKSS